MVCGNGIGMGKRLLMAVVGFAALLGPVHAQRSDLFTPAVCTSAIEQDCRAKAQRCISVSCEGTSPDQPNDYRDCRTPCFVSLKSCLTINFCE